MGSKGRERRTLWSISEIWNFILQATGSHRRVQAVECYDQICTGLINRMKEGRRVKTGLIITKTWGNIF